jgi:small subunit ribosomal protein S4
MLKGDRCSTPKCAVEKRTTRAQRGGHRRRRVSDRGLQLREKQRARYTYGVLERQFRKLFADAERMSGITSDNLLVLLERRLDNVVYRLGFADSRAQARQIVRHGHILVDGRRCDIPSRLVKVGQTISWHEAAMKSEYYKAVKDAIADRLRPGWLGLDENTMTGRVTALPEVADIDTRYDGKAIVEYYSR